MSLEENLPARVTDLERRIEPMFTRLIIRERKADKNDNRIKGLESVVETLDQALLAKLKWNEQLESKLAALQSHSDATETLNFRLSEIDSALRAQAACMEEQGARIVKLERRQADIERRVACLDSMADEHAKGIEAMKSRSVTPISHHLALEKRVDRLEVAPDGKSHRWDVPAGMEISSVQFKPTPAEADVGIGGTP